MFACISISYLILRKTQQYLIPYDDFLETLPVFIVLTIAMPCSSLPKACGSESFAHWYIARNLPICCANPYKYLPWKWNYENFKINKMDEKQSYKVPKQTNLEQLHVQMGQTTDLSTLFKERWTFFVRATYFLWKKVMPIDTGSGQGIEIM